ncbi:hypothetical protein GCM10023174_28690 [Chelativorans composti]
MAHGFRAGRAARLTRHDDPVALLLQMLLQAANLGRLSCALPAFKRDEKSPQADRPVFAVLDLL